MTRPDHPVYPFDGTMGMTVREYFAVQAMMGILSCGNIGGVSTFKSVAADAVRMAEALIEALNKERM